ncbi:MAG: organomercurial lyase [Nocardioidaceae bacterium]
MTTPSDRILRLRIYAKLAATGLAPGVAELVEDSATSPDDVRAALRRLAEQRHVVLDRDDAILMAHPFATLPLGFSVMGTSTLWWGGCAWDSFAVPHLVTSEPDVLVATRCPGCDSALGWVVGRDAPPSGEEVAHFLVPVARMWNDVLHTCGHQRLFCSPHCVGRWLTDSRNERGYVMDLETLWRLASHWYDGRLSLDYTRREPAQAAEYFRNAGLTGPFWGL